LLRHLSLEAVRRLYRRTVLGKVWLVLRPVLPVVVAAFVFGQLLQIPSEGVPYFLFYLVGNTQWRLFARGFLFVSRSVTRSRSLSRRMYFPRLLAPLSSLAPAIVDLGIHLALIALALGYYRVAAGRSYLGPASGWAWIPVSLVLTAALALAIGLWTSVAVARVRDLLFAIRHLFGPIFFVTPVLYPLSAVPERWRAWVELNPLTGLAVGFRHGVLGVGGVDLSALLPAILVIVVVGGSGVWYFFRADRVMADQV
jgi:lipopolysaccharide transport system permease protein